MTPDPIRSRREVEARLLAATRRRAALQKPPSLAEAIAGVTAFLGFAAACLYAVARLGA